MVVNTVKLALSVLVFFLLNITSAQNSENVLLNVKTMNLDSIVTVPRWMVPQSSPSSLLAGLLPLGDAPPQSPTLSEDLNPNDVALVASYLTDIDFYQIRLDTNLFAKENLEIKVVDSQTIQVEAELKKDSSRIKRRFLVPMSYDVYRVYSEVDKSGTLNITVPRKLEKVVGVGNTNKT